MVGTLRTVSVAAIALIFCCSVCAVPRSAHDLKSAIMKAHTGAFGNSSNALTQRLLYDVKQFWQKTVSEVQEFVLAIETKKSILPSKEKTAQKEAKKMLIVSMDRLMAVNNDLLNTIASVYGQIAVSLPAAKKQTGTRKLADIDPKKIDIRTIGNMVNPLEAQKLVAIDVQDKVKKLPEMSNVGLKQGAELVALLALFLETTVDFTLNSYKKLAEYVKIS